MQRKSWLIAIPAVIVIILGTWFLVVRSRGKETAAAYTPVKVERARLATSVDATGSVTPTKTIDLAPSSVGRITALTVEVGDHVRVGQILAKLDATEAQSRLRSAQDALNVSEKKLQTAEKDAVVSPVQALAQVAEAKTSLSTANDTLSAVKSRATAGTKDVSAAESDLTQAKLDLAIAAVNAVGSGINGELATARAAMRDAQDALASAKKDAAEMVLAAPIDGVVTQVNGRVGAATPPDQASLISVADTNRLLVDATVDENDIAQVKPGQSAIITLGALPDEEFKGEVISVGEVGTADSSGVVTFPVKVSLEDPAHLVKAGMTADVSIVTADRQNVLAVPNAALETRMGRTAVRILLADGRIAFRQVQTGLRTETTTEITAGLRVGDEVAVPTVAAPTSKAGDNKAGFGLGPGLGGFGGQQGHGSSGLSKGGVRG